MNTARTEARMPAPPAVDPTLSDALVRTVRGYVARRVRAEFVDDVTQDALVRVHRGLPKLRDASKIVGWASIIARSAVIEHANASRRLPEPRDALPEPPPEPSEPDDAFRDLMQQLTRAVADRLPAPYREAVTRVDLDGLTQAEAATEAQISLSGMKSRVQRGRRMLRDALDQMCAYEFDARHRVVGCTPRAACACGGDDLAESHEPIPSAR
jgi:RNA polymerase sigma-70 factor (ECF subfamily)